jgi:hypothetical protein
VNAMHCTDIVLLRAGDRRIDWHSVSSQGCRRQYFVLPAVFILCSLTLLRQMSSAITTFQFDAHHFDCRLADLSGEPLSEKEMRQTQVRLRSQFLAAFAQATGTLDRSLNLKDGLQRLAEYPFTIKDMVYLFHLALATFWIILMQQPSFPVKLLIPILYALALLIPLTSQFFIPATPIFAYLLTFYSSRFIPEAWRPPISVATLPTLESVLYGANISDILTRYTNPFLDIVAWIPYGVLHFTAPFIIAACVWLFAPKPTLKFWATAFGYMNLLGVICQIIFPCAAPCKPD